jgi:hypothetical protein
VAFIFEEALSTCRTCLLRTSPWEHLKSAANSKLTGVKKKLENANPTHASTQNKDF